MMNCKDTKRNLSAFLDGELSPISGDDFFAHLQVCEHCCDLVGEASFNEALFANVMKVRVTAPASLRYNVLSAISREKARPVYSPAWRRFAWRPATAMAAMLAFAGAGWRTFTTSFEPSIPMVRSSERARVAGAPSFNTGTGVTPRVRPATARVKPAPPVPKPNEPKPEPVPPTDGTPVSPKAAPIRIADAFIGAITSIQTPNNEANGRFLSSVDGKTAWKDAPADVRVNTHMQSAEDTIVTLVLRDGTIVKSNAQTEFVVQRSPTKDDPAWQIRLVRGEVWIKSSTDVVVIAPSMEARCTRGEFGVRSVDTDSTVVVMEGLVACHNPLGTSLVATAQATSAIAGEAPREAFRVDDPRSQMDWVYAPTPAHNPQNDGGTQA